MIWLAATGLAIAVIAALIAALIWGLGRILQILSPVLWPIAVAGVLAYLLDPVVDRLEQRKFSRRNAILTVFGLALLLIAALSASVVPQLVTETRQLASRVPAYARNAQVRVEHFINHPPPLVRKLFAAGAAAAPPAATAGVDTNAASAVSTTNTVAGPAAKPDGSPVLNEQTLQQATSWLTQLLPKIGQWLFGQVGRVAGWFGVLAGLALIPVYAFYFLLEKRGISSRWTDYLPMADSAFKTELVFALNNINNYLIAFFRGQVLVAICDGIMYALGFLLIGLPYAVLIGAMAVFLTMIPYLGAIVTCVTALLIALVTFGDWLHPVLVLMVFGVVQTLEGLVVSPRIMGGRVGLHPVTIIIAVMAGTTLLGGLLGGILAIPLTAALRVLMTRYVWKRPAPVGTEGQSASGAQPQ